MAASALITANVMADTNSYEIGVAAGYNGTSNSKLEDNHVNYNGRIAKRLDEAKTGSFDWKARASMTWTTKEVEIPTFEELC